ncbi:MAG: ExbD/TolR family protein [Candidatus Brocadiia bacterium]|nr:biopolymer transporter ExbD [Planctomycetota bacterium]
MYKKDTRRNLNLPLTPLIDCTFLLIIFFLLATQLAGRELPDLLLPAPQENVSSQLPEDQKRLNHVTVNVLNQYGNRMEGRDPALSSLADRYQIGVDRVEVGRPDAIATLVGLLESRRAQADSRGVSDFWVEIRADRDIRYGDVQPVMQAASNAGIEIMSLTTRGEKNSSGQNPGDRKNDD